MNSILSNPIGRKGAFRSKKRGGRLTATGFYGSCVYRFGASPRFSLGRAASSPPRRWLILSIEGEFGEGGEVEGGPFAGNAWPVHWQGQVNTPSKPGRYTFCPDPALSQSVNHHRALSGAVLCAIAALGYTSVNVCMRQLTILECDPVWAVFNRELVTAVAIGPWLFYQAGRGRLAFPTGRTLGLLVLTGLMVEVVANLCIQWALGVVGLAVVVPASFGVMITGGAVLGHFWLGEAVSARSTAAIGLLLVALVLLGMGVEAAGPSIADPNAARMSPLMLVLGVAAASLAGGVFALLNVTIRHSVTRTTLPIAIAFLIPMLGAVSLGPLSLSRSGWQLIWSTSWEQYVLMAAAGAFNLIAFLAFVNGLQRTTVVHANAVNASQVAMAAVAGVAMFHESPNAWLLLGVFLTIGGILAFDRPTESGGL